MRAFTDTLFIYAIDQGRLRDRPCITDDRLLLTTTIRKLQALLQLYAVLLASLSSRNPCAPSKAY